MKREILDTNIYGKILDKGDVDFVLNNLPKSNIIIYGSDIIRKELRDTPKEKIIIAENKKVKIRILLLNLYDFINADAIKSYELVNSIKKLKTPNFKSYEEFKNAISKK